MYKFYDKLLYRQISCIMTKPLLIMKLSLVLLLAATLKLSAASYAQEINITVKNASLKEVFKLMRSQSGYNFLYNNEVLSETKPVTLDIKNGSLNEALQLCIANQPISYAINQKNVVIHRKPLSQTGAQQDIVITGTVLDETGLPLPNVSIKLKGSNTTVASGTDGKYTIKAPDGAGMLVFSFVGYATQEVAIGNRSRIDVTMKEQSSDLTELVIVGYGTQKKSDLTGAISVVSEKRLREIPAGNIASALQGAAPGVQIQKAGGNSHPGSTPVVRIRGERSLGAGNDPLIILDGIPYSGSLNDISQDDITSVSVLKDASSAAIYGSRGANGVLLINTRRGKMQKTSIRYDAYTGFNRVLGNFDMMTAEEFATFKKWAKLNGSATNAYTGFDDPDLLGDAFGDAEELAGYNAGVNTDWQGLLYKNGIMNSHAVGLNGGTENTQYDVSLGYYNAEGIYEKHTMSRYTLKINIDQKLGKYIKIGLNSLNTYNLLNGLDINPVSQALQASPFASPYNADGTLRGYLPGANKNVWNPISDFVDGAMVDEKIRLSTFTTGFIEANLTGGFKYKLNAGIQISPETEGRFYGTQTTRQLGDKNAGFNGNGTGYEYTIENILTYDKVIATNHTVNFTGLFSLQEQKRQWNYVRYRDILADYIQYHNPKYASNVTSDGSFNKWDILSYMGRLNYGYKDKYLFTATIRADGSSRLTEGNKWHYFPSASLGWIISKENFMSNVTAVDFLKLRGGYGSVGNTGIEPYETIGGLSESKYNYGSDLVQGTYPNPESPSNVTLEWERTNSLNIGLEFGLFNNRLTGSIENYTQWTNEILLNQSLPASSGYTKIRSNIGKTENRGMELSLSSINFSGGENKGFRWSTDLNVFYNRNKIVSLSSGVERDLGNGWFVGEPNGVIFDYKRTGIWQNTPEDIAYAQKLGLTVTGTSSVIGTVKVEDVNGDSKINNDDRVILGSRQPKFEGGIGNTFGYKNFDLTVLAYFKSGGLMKTGIHGGWMNTFQGIYNNVNLNYWTPTNGENYWPKPNSALQNPAYKSTLDMVDASYLKIRNISLGYTLPDNSLKRIGVSRARVYTNVSNPFVFFSDYKSDFGGLDPETNRDLDINSPALWTMVFGLNVTF